MLARGLRKRQRSVPLNDPITASASPVRNRKGLDQLSFEVGRQLSISSKKFVLYPHTHAEPLRHTFSGYNQFEYIAPSRKSKFLVDAGNLSVKSKRKTARLI